MRASQWLLMIAASSALAQSPAPEIDTVRIGPGVTPPKLLTKVEPEYTPQARSAMVQGKALFEVVVDVRGRVTNVALVSPIGFGLDENAQRALESWVFRPGEKDGKPVPILAHVEVNFRFTNTWYDSKTEGWRTSYNTAVHSLQRDDEKGKARAVETIQKLSRQNYPPAIFTEGILLRDGKLLPANPEESLKLLVKASEKNYGPAMYEVGRKYMDGVELPKDAAKGMGLIRDSAVLGSFAAQFFLGARYEFGDGVPQDTERARRYYRLCASANQAACQFKLASLMMGSPNRRDRDYVQAIAWLQLAAEHGQAQASALLEKERPNITVQQLFWASKLKSSLIQAR